MIVEVCFPACSVFLIPVRTTYIYMHIIHMYSNIFKHTGLQKIFLECFTRHDSLLLLMRLWLTNWNGWNFQVKIDWSLGLCDWLSVCLCAHVSKKVSIKWSIHSLKDQSAYEKNEKWSRISTSYLGYPQNKRSPQKFTTGAPHFSRTNTKSYANESLASWLARFREGKQMDKQKGDYHGNP